MSNQHWLWFWHNRKDPFNIAATLSWALLADAFCWSHFVLKTPFIASLRCASSRLAFEYILYWDTANCFNTFNALLLPCQASYKEAMVWRCSNFTNSLENICAGVSLRSIITAKDSSAGFFLRVLWNFWKHLLCKPSANSYFWILACRDCWNLTHFLLILKYCVPFFLTTNCLKRVWPFLAGLGLEGLSLMILSFTYFSETFFNFFH